MTGRPPSDPLAIARDVLTGADEGRAASTFMRGLTLGALLGAALAGSLLWQRRGRPAGFATAEHARKETP